MIDLNHYVLNFLDLQFDLKNHLYRLYKKPKNDAMHIDAT